MPMPENFRTTDEALEYMAKTYLIQLRKRSVLLNSPDIISYLRRHKDIIVRNIALVDINLATALDILADTNITLDELTSNLMLDTVIVSIAERFAEDSSDLAEYLITIKFIWSLFAIQFPRNMASMFAEMTVQLPIYFKQLYLELQKIN